VSNETKLILRHWRDAVPDDRMAHLIRDAARSLERGLQARLADHNIPFGHWTFLRILWEKDGLTQRELSQEAGVTEATTTMVVRQMETNGHLVRRHMGDNRRKQHVFLTPAGKTLKKQLVPLAVEVNQIAMRDLSKTQVIKLREYLLGMIENLAESETADDNSRP